MAEFDGFLKTRAAHDFLAKKQFVSARRLGEVEIAGLYNASLALKSILAARPDAAIFEHERFLYPNYPQEWLDAHITPDLPVTPANAVFE